MPFEVLKMLHRDCIFKNNIEELNARLVDFVVQNVDSHHGCMAIPFSIFPALTQASCGFDPRAKESEQFSTSLPPLKAQNWGARRPSHLGSAIPGQNV